MLAVTPVLDAEFDTGPPYEANAGPRYSSALALTYPAGNAEVLVLKIVAVERTNPLEAVIAVLP